MGCDDADRLRDACVAMQTGWDIQCEQRDIIKQAQRVGGFDPVGIRCRDRLIQADTEQAIDDETEPIVGLIRDIGMQYAAGREKRSVCRFRIRRCLVVGGPADAAAGVAQSQELGGADQRIAAVIAGSHQNQDRVGAVARQLTHPFGSCRTGPLHESRLRVRRQCGGFDGAYAVHREK